jgi:citronellol/citronellal dehydrogenase
MNFNHKTIVITGASRGIGHAIGLKMASLGANIAILAKTIEVNPKLPGTIYSAAEDMKKASEAILDIGSRGKVIALMTDIRFEDQVLDSIQKVVETFGGIDMLVNNASAITLSSTLGTDMKRYDLMHSINTRGTFLCSKACIPHLLKSENPHVLNLSPPLTLDPKWFKDHTAYTISKFGMSMCTLGMAEEFRHKIAFNALWPKTSIATAVVSNLLGGEDLIKRSRKPAIVADAAAVIFAKDKTYSGNFLIDEQVLRESGMKDFSPYRISPELSEEDLQTDFYI